MAAKMARIHPMNIAGRKEMSASAASTVNTAKVLLQ